MTVFRKMGLMAHRRRSNIRGHTCRRGPRAVFRRRGSSSQRRASCCQGCCLCGKRKRNRAKGRQETDPREGDVQIGGKQAYGGGRPLSSSLRSSTSILRVSGLLERPERRAGEGVRPPALSGGPRESGLLLAPFKTGVGAYRLQ